MVSTISRSSQWAEVDSFRRGCYEECYEVLIACAQKSSTVSILRLNNLKPFPYLTFPHSADAKIATKWPSFDGELMASYLTSSRNCGSRKGERQETAQTTIGRRSSIPGALVGSRRK
jgi:hypothetical protein